MQSRIGDSRQPYAIIVGLDDVRGVYAAHTLARHNVPMIAIARDPQSFGCRTRVCQEIHVANTDNEECIETLMKLGPRLNHKAVLFPCFDTTVLLVSRYRQQLEQWYHVVLPAPDIVEMMLDKVGFYTYAQNTGLPIPRTFFLYNRADAEEAVQHITFPCVLKPASSKSPAWRQLTHVKAFKIFDTKEFLDLYDRYSGATDVFIAQEWVEGTDSSLYVCYCYFDANVRPIITFVSRKLRQWPPETGDGSLIEECRNDVVLHETVRAFESVQFRGLGYLELKRDTRSGQYFIMEPNIGRTAGIMAVAEAGGVELLYTMYCDAVGWPLPTKLTQKYGRAKWVYLRKDMQSALHYWRQGELTLPAWWRSLRGETSYGLFSWRDPGPFLGDIQHALRLFLSSRERRKRTYQRGARNS